MQVGRARAHAQAPLQTCRRLLARWRWSTSERTGGLCGACAQMRAGAQCAYGGCCTGTGAYLA
eukprot:10267373-Alexandrium_andersonii.AAC.1